MAHDHQWQDAGSAATRWAITALITGVCGALANTARNLWQQRQQRVSLASSVENIREVIAPSAPEKEDLGTRVDRIQFILSERENRLKSLEDGQRELHQRLDGMQDEASKRHSELCSLIVQSRR